MNDLSRALPPGWRRASLDDVVNILDRLRVPVNAGERATRQGSIPYYGATGQVGWIDKHIFDEELVLLGEDAAPFFDPAKPKAYLVRGKSWVNNHAHVLRGTRVSNSFLMHQLNALDYHGAVTGTTRLKLPQAPMKKLPLLIPPAAEQDRIVAEIEKQFSRIDAGVKALKRLQAHLRRYRASLMESAFRDPEGHVPSGWRIVRLGELMSDGAQNGLYLPKSKYGSGTPILRIDDFQDFWSRSSSDLRCVEATDTERTTYLLQPGDLVVNRVNSPSHLGKTLCVEKRHIPALFESNMMRFQLATGVRPEYVALFLRSPSGRAALVKNAKWAVNQASINQRDVAATSIPVPPEGEDQDRVVASLTLALSELEHWNSVAATSLAKADRLRAAILRAAFDGRLVASDEDPARANVA